MNHYSIILSIICLFISFQSHFVFADIFTTTNKNIRIEVIDYRDFFEDVLFWIHHTKDIPVVAQKLINNGIYPISVTVYNESDISIKVMKNAIGGLSSVQDHEVTQLYQYDTIARVVKQAIFSAVATLVVVETLNSVTDFHVYLVAWKDYLKQLCEGWHTKLSYGLSSLSGLYAGAMHWSEMVKINNIIKQTFKSQALAEESIVAPNCSMSFLLFASHAPSGYILKFPVLDEQDNQVVSFECPFE